MMQQPYPPPSSWLRRLTIAEAEAELRHEAVQEGCALSPAWLARWETFTAQQAPGDELWYWENYPEPLTGGAGYCLVRNGACIAVIATARS